MVTDHVEFYNALHMVGVVRGIGGALDTNAFDGRSHGWAVVE